MNRADRSVLANWWFTVDRIALLLMLVLAGIGLMLAFAASPAVTGRHGTADFHYALRQIAYALVAVAILGGASVLDQRQIRIVAAVTFALALIGCFPHFVLRCRSAGRPARTGPGPVQPSSPRNS